MIDLTKLLEEIGVEVEGEVSEEVGVGLLIGTVGGLRRRAQEAEASLSAARSFSMNNEVMDLKASIARLEATVKSMAPSENERWLEARRDRVSGRSR